VRARGGEQEVAQVTLDVLAPVADLDPFAARADEVLQRGVEVHGMAHLVKVGDLQVGSLPDSAFVGLQLAQDHLEQRGFACAAWPHNCGKLACMQMQMQRPQCRRIGLLGPIAKCHISQLN